MIKYILKKLVYGVLVLLGVTIVLFLLFNVLPGDPASVMLGQRANKEAIEAINHDLGRDKPLLVQYLMYLNDLSPLSFHNQTNKESAYYLDEQKYGGLIVASWGKESCMLIKAPYFRRSYISKRKVAEIIKETLPETTVLAISSILFAAVIGISMGVLAAIRRNSWFDKLVLMLSALGMSAPSFFIGLILARLLGFVWSDYTGLNPEGSLYTTSIWEGTSLTLKNLILPALTLGMRPLAVIVQLTRSSLLDVLSQDYIRTARAKGLSFYTLVTRHALKNALNPVITAISGWFAGLMAGAVLVEIIFNWKGIGYEVYDALTKNDLPVVMGATLFFATFFIIINILVDILYGVLDPRVRLK